MYVKENPDFNVCFNEESYKDFRWFYNRILPQIKGRDWVNAKNIKIKDCSRKEIEQAIVEGAKLGLWLYSSEFWKIKAENSQDDELVEKLRRRGQDE